MVSSISAVGSYMSQINMQAMQQNRQKGFNKTDSDGDGAINQTEFDAVVVKLSEKTGTEMNSEDAFSTYDADGDGTLSQDEMDSFMKENAPAPPSGRNNMSSGDMSGGGMPMGPPPGMASPEEMFSNSDTDGDGGINQTELQDLMTQMAGSTGSSVEVGDDTFAAYDTDEDGTLNQDEMDSFMKENAPAPPSGGQMQQAISAYGSATANDQLSSLMDLLNQATTGSTSTDSNTFDLQRDYISKLMESMGSYGGGQYTYSPLNIKV